MKQVVIKGIENRNDLLTPYWTQEYFKRNGQEVFVYILTYENENTEENVIECIDGVDIEVDFEIDIEAKTNKAFTCNLVTDKELINDFKKIYTIFIVTKNFGSILTEDELKKIDILTYDVYYDALLKDRENKHLIDIAKEVNNDNFLKIIEIPDDVKYEIKTDDYSNEWIEECHRKWF